MKNEWKPAKQKLFGKLPACEHVTTGEVVSASKLGEIWEFSENRLSAVVYKQFVVSRLVRSMKSALFYPIKPGEEMLITGLSVEYLDQVAEALGIKNNRPNMAKILNGKS